jgi:hypothetical protein
MLISSDRNCLLVKDYVSWLSIADRHAGIRRGRETLSPRYIQKIVVMHACVRSVANKQLREKRFVIITRGRFAIRLNPFGVLGAERIVHLTLKLRVTRNLRDED